MKTWAKGEKRTGGPGYLGDSQTRSGKIRTERDAGTTPTGLTGSTSPTLIPGTPRGRVLDLELMLGTSCLE